MSRKASSEVVINDAAWKVIQKKLEAFTKKKDGPSVKVGVFQTAGEYEDGMSIVEVAALQEFGSPGGMIPERSFLREPLKNAKDDMAKISERIMKAIVAGKMDEKTGLALLGQWAVKTCRNAITEGDGIPPPNAPSTIAKKKSSRPLVGNTGRLINSITYQVSGENAEEPHGGGAEAGGSEPEVEAE